MSNHTKNKFSSLLYFYDICSPKYTTMNNLLVLGFLGGMGAPEIIVILIIVLLLFGGKKIPELMRGLGRGVKEFKDAAKGEDKSENASQKN